MPSKVPSEYVEHKFDESHDLDGGVSASMDTSDYVEDEGEEQEHEHGNQHEDEGR